MLTTLHRHLEPAHLVQAAIEGSAAEVARVWGDNILLVQLDDPSGTATRTLRTGVLNASAAKIVAVPHGGTQIEGPSTSLRPQGSWPESLLAQQLKHRLVRGPHMAVALVKRGGKPISRDDRFSIGRSAESDLLLATNGISKTHAWIRVDEKGRHELVDSGSRNGTTLNSTALTPSRPAALSPGDVIGLGGLEVMFCPTAAVWTLVRGG